jgi:hypothetical protein
MAARRMKGWTELHPGIAVNYMNFLIAKNEAQLPVRTRISS